MTSKNVTQTENHKQGGGVERGVSEQRCENCGHLGYEPAHSIQLYAEIWCKKDVFDGVDSYDELDKTTECPHWIAR